MRSAPVVYPTLEALHIIAIAITFGSLWIVELRLMGVRLFGLGSIDVRTLATAMLPWTLLGFTLAAIVGSLMFLTKMLLLLGTNAAILHSRGPLNPESRFTRGQALFSLLLWIGIIFCGRWIAYV